MLLKWKCILTNWINCYCNERDTKDLDINLDSLLIIISQLRRNLSLDDSRSSLLEAHNIQEFVLEKYPDFKFENGSSGPNTDEDLYLSASLLLFFVCVNSKNIDLKNAMCSKLSSSDQEIIMKYSKCLMGCRNITSSDVQQAITEACGQDIAGLETEQTESKNTVAETPPALRSLHSEVRRLQAALDAERFDRNYLQEELSRTNLKLEKLSKVKEQYKMEIVNLKAKASDCGENTDTAGNEASHNNSAKLVKQLEQAEERLANLQEELSNAEYERNSYKNKLDELKHDRDKYLALSQHENIRASQLAEELDSERRQCNSLRELVTELRQHNRLNRMDSSQLECDDLDASVHSLQHNSSVCSEVCASIIEVQLAEERTRITTLKNEILMLQDQLTELNNKHDKEKNEFSKTLSEKECDIMNLKHRINEEIECKNVMKSQYDYDITKLNNEINELEQTLKDTTDNARKTIDTKMQEIQTVQEEKLSLLQSFSNETSKLESKIQELKKEVEAEKASKQKIREDYDNHIMKLNEKVLNRNNELVELQNKIVVKGEEIESLQLQLRNEKDMRQELINKHNNDVLHYNNVIKEQNHNAQKSSEEIAELRKQVQQYYQCVEEMNKERNDLNTSLLSLKEEVKSLTSEKQTWINDKEKLQHEFDEKNETINSLKSQLQTEIQFKNEIQTKLQELESEKEILSEEKTTLTNKLTAVIAESSETCEKLNQCVVTEKQASQSLQIQLDNSTKKVAELMELLEQKKDEINKVQDHVIALEQNNEKLISDFESERLILKNMVSVTESVMEDQKVTFTNEIEEYSKSKDILQKQIKELEEVVKTEKVNLETSNKELNEIKIQKVDLEKNIIKLNNEIVEKTRCIDILNQEKDNFTKSLCENNETINKLKDKMKGLIEDKIKLTQNLDSLKQEFLMECELLKKERTLLSEDFIKIEKLKDTLEKRLTAIEDKMTTEARKSEIELEKKVKDIEILLKELNNLKEEKLSIEVRNEELQEDVTQQSLCIEKLRCEKNELTTTLKHNKEAISNLHDEIKALVEDKNKIINDFNDEKQQLLSNMGILDRESKQSKDTLQKQIEGLEEIIEVVKQKAKGDNDKIEKTLADLECLKEEKRTVEENISRLQEDIQEKTSFIESLKSENNKLVATITQNKEDLTKVKYEMKEEMEANKKQANDYEYEKQELLNKIAVLEEHKMCLENNLSENKHCQESLQREIQNLDEVIKTERQQASTALDVKAKEIEKTLTELNNLKKEKINIEENMATLQEEIIQKTSHVETLKTENNELASTLKLNKDAMSLLEEEIKAVTKDKNKLVSEFESEKQELERIISETRSIMEKQRQNLNDEILEQTQSKDALQEQVTSLQSQLTQVRLNASAEINEKKTYCESTVKELNVLKEEKIALAENINSLKNELLDKVSQLDVIQKEKRDLEKCLEDNQNTITLLQQELVIVKQENEDTKNALEYERNDLSSKMALIETLKEENILHSQNELKHIKANEILQEEVVSLQNMIKKEKLNTEARIDSLEADYKAKVDEINSLRAEKDILHQDIDQLRKDVSEKAAEVERLSIEKNNTIENLQQKCSDFEINQSSIKANLCSGVQNVISNLQNGGINGDIITKLQEIQNECDFINSFENIMEAVNILTRELSIRKSLEKALEEENTAVEKLTSLVKQKEANINQTQEELNNIQRQHSNSKLEFSKQAEEYRQIIDAKTEEVENLVLQNTTLHNELNDVKIQLDTKVHSLKDKLIDNENITDKLKTTYESQIDNLNVMVSKLTSYLKEKTIEIESISKEKLQLEEALNKSNKAVSCLEEDVQSQKQKHQTLINEFESERAVLKNMVSVTEEVMEDQKLSLSNKIDELSKQNDLLKNKINKLEEEISTERMNAKVTLEEKVDILNIALKDLSEIKDVKKTLDDEILTLKELLSNKSNELDSLMNEKNSLNEQLESVKNDKTSLVNKVKEFEAEKENKIIENTNLLKEKENEIIYLKEQLERQTEAIKHFEYLQETLSKEKDEIIHELNEKDTLLETEKKLRQSQFDEVQKLQQLKADNLSLQKLLKEKESEITAIKEHLKNDDDRNQKVSEQNKIEQINLANKCEILAEYQMKAEEELKYRQTKIEVLVSEMESIKNAYAKVELEKNALKEKLETELRETKQNYLHYKQEAEKVNIENGELREDLNIVNTNTVYNLKKENELLLKAVTNKENMGVHDKENIPNYREDVGIKIRDLQNQVHDSAFDNTTSSVDSSKTITDLEKIIQDKNRTITTLHSDISYLKTLIAESENKLLDVTKDLDLSRENCHQLSNQLKKVVYQKNEEIAELKNKVTKMSATETRATQIIKVSAKYQAMILKRIAEIKNKTVLKEVTNFGNSANSSGDNELRRSFNAGNITMEDLENFLETTDRHLKRCSEKQIALQKERDRLLEINKINESEIIAMRKFLTELSVSVKTFNSVKELYSQKLNRVIALQRTVRREILNLDGRINDATMCKLERGYAAIMQDLSECALNLERWVDRSIVRSISPEKIKQAFMSELDRASLVPTNFQNTSLEIQFGELESSFQKLLKEVMQAQSGEGAKDTQALTLMEVRAEYEDKLSRMKAKMKELYVDQINQFREQQKKEIEEYERKLQKSKEELQDMSKAYEQHIVSLTTELWSVGEKFVIQQDEAQWLRKQQKSGSLMSLQHVHSNGLAAPREDPGRPSDTLSLRSLPAHGRSDKRGRRTCGDMSDEEGEVFDNRCLRELTETPRRGRPSAAGTRGGAGAGAAGGGAGAGERLSVLQRRNTLCPPHLKSSYPAETQFVPGLQEDDIKCNGSMSLGGKAQRKEVGITAYKKPGPPTPSKQAGRLSATDSELRESLRVEAEPGARRTATPSRLFNMFRGKQDSSLASTPRGRRLSNIFRKK